MESTKQQSSGAHYKQSVGGIIASVIIYTVMILFALFCIFPLVYELTLSFASQADYLSAKFFVIPRHFNIEAYKYIFYQDRIVVNFLISLFVTVVGTIYSMILTSFGAYVLSKDGLPFGKVFFTIILITMFFGGGLIPFYLTVKGLHLNNSLASLIIPNAINTFNMIILRNFFAQVPQDLLDSCDIDGCGEFRKLFMFVIPLAKAGFATICLYYVVEKWNDWYWPMIFLGERDDLYPLALELRNVLTANQSDGYGAGGNVDIGMLFSQGQNAAMIIVSILPMLILYPFVQKYFTKGVMFGALKG